MAHCHNFSQVKRHRYNCNAIRNLLQANWSATDRDETTWVEAERRPSIFLFTEIYKRFILTKFDVVAANWIGAASIAAEQTE